MSFRYSTINDVWTESTPQNILTSYPNAMSKYEMKASPAFKTNLTYPLPNPPGLPTTNGNNNNPIVSYVYIPYKPKKSKKRRYDSDDDSEQEQENSEAEEEEDEEEQKEYSSRRQRKKANQKKLLAWLIPIIVLFTLFAILASYHRKAVKTVY